jgi:outer membrane receptor for Fe3+-dicitrate
MRFWGGLKDENSNGLTKKEAKQLQQAEEKQDKKLSLGERAKIYARASLKTAPLVVVPGLHYLARKNQERKAKKEIINDHKVKRLQQKTCSAAPE